MTMHRTALRPTLLALVLMGLSSQAIAATQGFAGPFDGGLKWIDGADLAEPWIPSAVTFGARDELVWVGTQVGSRKLLAYAAPELGVAAPVYQDPAIGLASHVLDLAAGPKGDQLFSLAHYPEPDLLHRRTVVARHSALHLGGGGDFSPEWSHPFPFVANGPALLAVDGAGDELVAAAFDDQTGSVHLRRLDGRSGATIFALDFVGAGLQALELSEDGERTVMAIGSRLLILDANGVVLHDQTLGKHAVTLALSADGSRLVAGFVGALRVYDEIGANYSLTHLTQASNDQVASRVAVSAAGETYAAAWWHFRQLDVLRLEVYEGMTHVVLNQIIQNGSMGSLQNAPVAVDMTADGRRIAFASWGRGDMAPEVILLERGQTEPVLKINLPGSAMGLDLDASGTRLAVVTKNLHANQFGSTGEVRLYDTGERDVTLLAPARLGTSLEVATRREGASFALFLTGNRSPLPTHPAGTSGSLWLLRNDRLQVSAVMADAQGEATLSTPIPSSPALLGLNLSVQVAHRASGSLFLSETVLDPLFY
ncbi:MAG: hypothetical protein ACI9F9_003192 [Candidatus Paceibacteria bacterium]|jgi:hypothetical protein